MTLGRRGRGLVVTGLAGLFVLGLSTAASAHPLGNFTVNNADRIVVRQGDVQVQHVVDTAEIPTLQLQQAADDRFGEETYYAKVDSSLPERTPRRWERRAEGNGAEG